MYYGKKIMQAVNSLPIKDDSLIFHLDFTNPDCYSGSGTTINDLTGIHQTQMVGSPLFNNTDKYFTFLSGSLDIITPDHSLTDLYPKNGSLTMRFFCGWKNDISYQFLYQAQTSNLNGLLGSGLFISTSLRYKLYVRNDANILMPTQTTSAGVTDLVNKWAWFTIIFDKLNDTIKVYNNTTLSSTYTGDWGTISGQDDLNFKLFGGGYPFKGYVQKVKIYNKALTIEEFTE